METVTDNLDEKKKGFEFKLHYKNSYLIYLTYLKVFILHDFSTNYFPLM